jgi:CBS domain-containing protein
MAVDAKAKDIMTAEVHSAKPNWSMAVLAEFFAKHRISGAPVVDSAGKLLGVVTVTDLARQVNYTRPEENMDTVHRYYDEYLGQSYSSVDESALQEIAHSSQTVNDVMTPLVFEVHQDTAAKEVALVLLNKHVHRVFVSDGDALVGIISSMDLLAHFAEQ